MADEDVPHVMTPAEYREKSLAVLGSAVLWLQAKEDRGQAWEAYMADTGDKMKSKAWDAFMEAERREREAMLASAAAIRAFVSPRERHPVSTMAVENERYRQKLSHLRAVVTTMRLDAERRNRDLDALHMVWCAGRCGGDGSVHRICGSPDDVTEEIVATAEQRVAQLRTWLEARKKRKAVLRG